MLGVDTSTVAGKFKITLLSGVAPQTSVTASHTSLANSSSVEVNNSGLYCSTHSVCGCAWANSLISVTDSTANCTTSVLLMLKTTSRNSGAVAL